MSQKLSHIIDSKIDSCWLKNVIQSITTNYVLENLLQSKKYPQDRQIKFISHSKSL